MQDSLQELPSKWTRGLWMGTSQGKLRDGHAKLEDSRVLGELPVAAQLQGRGAGRLGNKQEK